MTEGRMEPVTYSAAYTLVPTYECFNRCGYCNFRLEPGAGAWLGMEEVERVLRRLSGTGTREILLLSGELHPKSQGRRALMQHIFEMAESALASPSLLVGREQVEVNLSDRVEELPDRAFMPAPAVGLGAVKKLGFCES